MVVWFAHVRVGHRQLSILKYPPTLACRGFFFVCGLVTVLGAGCFDQQPIISYSKIIIKKAQLTLTQPQTSV